MRTTIDLNEELILEAFSYANVTKRQELIELALREFVENHRCRKIQELKYKANITEDYDYKSLRIEKSK